MARKSELIPACIELSPKDILLQIKLLGYESQEDMERKLWNKKAFSGLSDLTRAIILIGIIMNKHELKDSMELQKRLEACFELEKEKTILSERLKISEKERPRLLKCNECGGFFEESEMADYLICKNCEG